MTCVPSPSSVFVHGGVLSPSPIPIPYIISHEATIVHFIFGASIMVQYLKYKFDVLTYTIVASQVFSSC